MNIGYIQGRSRVGVLDYSLVNLGSRTDYMIFETLTRDLSFFTHFDLLDFF